MDYETEEPTQIETTSLKSDVARTFALNFAAMSGVLTAMVLVPVAAAEIKTRWLARKAKKTETTEND